MQKNNVILLTHCSDCKDDSGPSEKGTLYVRPVFLINFTLGYIINTDTRTNHSHFTVANTESDTRRIVNEWTQQWWQSILHLASSNTSSWITVSVPFSAEIHISSESQWWWDYLQSSHFLKKWQELILITDSSHHNAHLLSNILHTAQNIILS